MHATAAEAGGKAPPPGTEAAIAFADIVGYTILCATDGERTLARWMRLLATVLEPEARARGARVVKSTGDGVLADFPSVAAAHGWARAVHAAAAADDAALPPITFRIAIHIGPMHYTDEGVYGATVNIAARLESHAPPGGIAFSEAARQALGEAAPPLDDLGTLSLRNIPDRVRAWAQPPAAPVRVPARPSPLDLPSVAVLPFTLPPGDEADRYLANGLIEDIVISLGNLRDLAVIARGATLGLEAAGSDPRLVGRILGVRYVLSGSVRRGAGSLRLSAVLRETEEGDSLWSDRIEIAPGELFAAQDAIVGRVVAGIAPGIRGAELRRALRKPPESLSAYDLTLRGMHGLEELSRSTFQQAGESLARAIADDPAFANALAWRSRWHSFAVGQGWTENPARDAGLVSTTATRAVDLDPRNALALSMCGHFRAYHLRDAEAALPFLDAAVEACPNHALSWTLRGVTLSYLGRGEAAVQAARRGLALSPRGAEQHYFHTGLASALFAAGDDAEAARWLRHTLATNPGFTSAHRILIAVLDRMGRHAEAAEVAGAMLRHEPAFSVAAYAERRAPYHDAALRTHLIGALERAGLPA